MLTGLLLTVNPEAFGKKFRQSKSPSEVASNGKGMVRNLLSLQERCVLIGQWKHGFLAFSPVGATNVGSISINSFPDMRTNSRGLGSNLTPALNHFVDYLPPIR